MLGINTSGCTNRALIASRVVTIDLSPGYILPTTLCEEREAFARYPDRGRILSSSWSVQTRLP